MEKIHFDARFIRLDYHDGISRFSVELINALSKRHKVVALIYDQRQLEFLPRGIEYLHLNSPQSVKELFIAKKLNNNGARIVFSPMQIMGSWGRKYKLVLTLHDLIYYRHRKPPQDLSPLIKIIWRLYHLSFVPQRLLLNRADTIVTVSDTTKKLIHKHHLTSRPVEIVYNGVAGVSQQSREIPKTRNLVYVGSFMPYKNVETLIRGVGLERRYTLHLLSKITPTRQSKLQRLADSVSASVIFHNGVSEDEYRNLLDGAYAVVSASKDEGFGIPLVEAMARGIPVVVSNLEIFQEVAGPAGTYFNPESPEALVEALQSISNPTIWKTKSTACYQRASVFNWDKSAEKLATILSQLSSEPNSR